MPDTTQTRHLALCFQLPSQPSDANERWLELIPAGTFSGIDGRTWSNTSPDSVVLNSAASAPRDIEHATHIKGPQGEEAPAYGWVEEFYVRDCAIWGRVAFNREGMDIIAERKYRYYSPAFLHDAQGNVTAIDALKSDTQLALNRATHTAKRGAWRHKPLVSDIAFPSFKRKKPQPKPRFLILKSR